MSLTDVMTQLARQAKTASRGLAQLSTGQKNACLTAMADALDQNRPGLLEANAGDMVAAAKMGLSSAMLDRLRLDDKRLAGMAEGLRQVAALPDPVGRILEDRTRPNGLRLQKISTPIGVVVIIYESRPNVTADAAGLCFKSGNAVILRGGKEAIHSNLAIAEVLTRAAERALPSYPAHAIQVVGTADHGAVRELLALTQYVDLCMPRGGERLIRAVADCSKVPVIKHYKGVCHVYVDSEADLLMAGEIAFNAKCQRPAVCNAMETLLVDATVAARFLPTIGARFDAKKVEMRADDCARQILKSSLPHPARAIRPATDQDFYTEYNDYVVNLRVVDGVAEAIAHINQYGSAHSDTIVTRDEGHARRFLAEVDSAAVYWNASTRFTDGGEFGMGAEIGISTDKIGARGPMGLEELTSYKWIGIGNGQIRT
jgi:glutamate-5-semialdehyde dehydrogenase